MLKVLRSEIKYLITLDEYYRFKDKLGKLMLQDGHNGADGYSIRSLYFDTVHDRDLFEKLDGLELRRKLRLRCYSSTDAGAKLELKQKQNTQQLKRSLNMSRENAMRLNRGDFSVLLEYSEPFALECYGLIQTRVYRPRVIIEYKRTAFIAKENDIRITFDRNIVATESNLELFSPELNMHQVLSPFNVVMEVKYNGFIPSYIKDMIRAANVSPVSVSKYVLGR